jgi:nicotinamide mononucleotide adenylyltransferase
MDQATDALARWRHNIFFVPQLIQNDVSSTKVRLFLRRGLSVRYLLPMPVVDYIEENGLYQDETTAHSAEKRDEKGGGSGNGRATPSTPGSATVGVVS